MAGEGGSQQGEGNIFMFFCSFLFTSCGGAVIFH